MLLVTVTTEVNREHLMQIWKPDHLMTSLPVCDLPKRPPKCHTLQLLAQNWKMSDHITSRRLILFHKKCQRTTNRTLWSSNRLLTSRGRFLKTAPNCQYWNFHPEFITNRKAASSIKWIDKVSPGLRFHLATKLHVHHKRLTENLLCRANKYKTAKE
jgi:hypothetical protein